MCVCMCVYMYMYVCIFVDLCSLLYYNSLHFIFHYPNIILIVLTIVVIIMRFLAILPARPLDEGPQVVYIDFGLSQAFAKKLQNICGTSDRQQIHSNFRRVVSANELYNSSKAWIHTSGDVE